MITAVFALGAAFLLDSSKFALAQGSNYGQFAPPDAYVEGSKFAYYGSENQWSRRQFSEEKADKSPKRRGQRQLLAILDGKPEDAIRWGAERLKEDPRDLEAMFTRTVAYCELGQVDQALHSMREAVEAGLPVERFLAGPRHLLKPLTERAEFQQFSRERSSGLIHGPMLGCVTERRARVWVRTWEAALVTIRVFAVDENGEPSKEVVTTASGKADPMLDFTATIDLTVWNPTDSTPTTCNLRKSPGLPSRTFASRH